MTRDIASLSGGEFQVSPKLLVSLNLFAGFLIGTGTHSPQVLLLRARPTSMGHDLLSPSYKAVAALAFRSLGMPSSRSARGSVHLVGPRA